MTLTREEAIETLGHVVPFATQNGEKIAEAIDMAIEALSAPSGDLISRADALMELNGVCSNWQDDAKVAEIIHALSSAEAYFTDGNKIAEWIPCSERLPSEDGFYIATCDGEICGEEQPFTGFAEFENRKWVDDEDDYQCVLAWMPLPEPYKGGDEE